jgi:hypothetical protein
MAQSTEDWRAGRVVPLEPGVPLDIGHIDE